MTIHDIISEARAEVARVDYDYKAWACVLSRAIWDVAARHGVLDLVRDMPDGDGCPRSFLDWLDRNE